MEVPNPDVSGQDLDDDPDGLDDIDGDHTWHYRYNRRMGMSSSPISTINFSPDGKLFVSGTATGDVKMWETARWSESARLKSVQKQEPRSIVISPTQRWLIAAYPSVLQIFSCKPPWNLVQAIHALPDPATGEPCEWYCIAFSPAMADVDQNAGTNGHDYYLTGFSTCHMSVMDYSGGWGSDMLKRTRTISHGTRPTSLAYTADGWWLVCGFECGQVQVWNAFSLTLERTLVSHTGRVADITTSPRNATYDSRFVSCSADQTLRVWHTSGWILEQICTDTKSDRHGVLTCTFSSTGNWLVSVSTELCVWRVCVTRRGKMLLRIHQRMSAACGAENLRAAAFCSFNDAIAVGSKDGVLALWTKVEGLPPEMISEARVASPTKMDSSSGNDLWSFDRRSLPRPMKRITPEGVNKSADSKGMQWFQRTHLRSLSMVSLAAANGVACRTSALGQNLAATAGGKLAMTTPPSGNARMRSNEANGTDIMPGPAGLAIIRNVPRCTTVPAKQWRTGGFDEVLDAFSADGRVGGSGERKAGDRRPIGLGLDCQRPSTCSMDGLQGDLFQEDPSPMQVKMKHACRGAVQRISLAPQVIVSDDKEKRGGSKS